MNWNDLVTQIAAAVIGGLILAGIIWLLTNPKIAGTWLSNRPWAVSAVTAFLVTIITFAIVWPVLGAITSRLNALEQNLRTWTLSGGGDKYGTLEEITYNKDGIAVNNTGEHDSTISTILADGKHPEQMNHILGCKKGYYMVKLQFTTQQPDGFALPIVTASQIQCAKLIQ